MIMIELVEQNEVFKFVVGHPQYLVSNCGRIYSLKSHKFLRQYLNGSRNNCSYLRVSIDGETKSVHRLVAAAFILHKSPWQDTVDHIDANKLNNRAENLQWLNNVENIKKGKHSWRPRDKKMDYLVEIERDYGDTEQYHRAIFAPINIEFYFGGH